MVRPLLDGTSNGSTTPLAIFSTWVIAGTAGVPTVAFIVFDAALVPRELIATTEHEYACPVSSPRTDTGDANRALTRVTPPATGLHVARYVATAQTHTFTLDASLGACTGPYVQKAKLALTFRTTRAISCETAISVVSSGSGTLTWTAPFGLGSSGASLQFTIDSSDGHTTTASYHGTITAQGNMFTGAHVSGTVFLNRGIQGADIGGDCPSSGRIASFAVTAITMSVS